MEPRKLHQLLVQVQSCRLCEDQLSPRPVLQAASRARILIAGQAPGRKVHQSGIPFDDASGRRLRDWLGVNTGQFYDPELFAILPMAFCYPGQGKSGDLPPPRRCATSWRKQLLNLLPQLELTVILGQYALRWHQPEAPGNVTESVRAWRQFWPSHIVLPHPSPRNNIWLSKNPWFETEVVPRLRTRIGELLL